MGRKKNAPKRSVTVTNNHSLETELTQQSVIPSKDADFIRNSEPLLVVLDGANWVSSERFDVSEIIISNLAVNEAFYGFDLNEELFGDSRFFVRFKLSNVDEYLGRIKLGHWPVLEESNVSLEFVMKDELESEVVMVSGRVDGPDEGVTGLVHLGSLKYVTVRPNVGVTLSEETVTLSVRVQILRRVFDECESLVDSTRPVWKRSMMSVMAWLRPEVLTSEARYGCGDVMDVDVDEESGSRKRALFDVSSFYEAIKPSKEEPVLEDDNLRELLPELRPYQRRAAYWMVQQEKGDNKWLDADGRSQIVSPLCMPINLIDTSTRFYYNPFSGNISLDPNCPASHVSGGILADEMGLGKTVELLSCIFAHQMPLSEIVSQKEIQSESSQKNKLKRLKKERVECICGAVSESYRYTGLWVQCDACDAWQHASCVGYSERRRNLKLNGDDISQENSNRKRKNDTEVVEVDGEFTCQTCLALIQATESPIASGATLIVCPTPILLQWHAEILRHTSPGSLQVCIYEGVKDTSFSDEHVIDIEELLSADIVLTTYDTLKEDLPHDSERHEGDRRFMRYGKRYPVVPTLLTRVLWWRICLDEAQMVEGNAAAAIELALRLHAKHRWCVTGTPIQRKLDDLYGLLRFLQAGPFDVHRWWNDVILNPYERGDTGARAFTHKFFKRIMWRSSKRHVGDELEIPAQEECVSWLSLSPIEEHFYQRQHETCVDDAREVVESFKNDVIRSKTAGSMSLAASSKTYINNLEAAKLFNSLLKLRQACCHPQVGSSGIRLLQKSPMSMEEILSVLVGKTKIEGEDALRKLVVALNGLAGISMIKEDFSQAVSLYKEALSLSEEHSEDFRIDPLLNIHIHHNLAESLPLSMKREETIGDDPSSSSCATNSHQLSARVQILKEACDDLKHKFLSVSSSKLNMAQQEFKKSYAQVCDSLNKRTDQTAAWWLEALHHIEQDRAASDELIGKIGEALSGSLNKKSKTSASFRSITALKFHVQTGLDALEESRVTLLGKLLEVDQTMDNPKEEDIIRVRYCSKCYSDYDGPACTHCELDEIFQVYEARLFRLSKGNSGEAVTSVEEAVSIQKKKSALNQFYSNLSRPDKNSASSALDEEDIGKKRNTGDKVTVSKSPSDLEVILTIIRNSSRGIIDRDRISAARRQLDLLEGMRKEYALARSLSIAQAHVLRAHDEIKMATSRLRIRENEDDNSIDALSPEELDTASVENSSEKFLAEASLSRIKGQLRYLKSLVHSKQTNESQSSDESIAAEKAAITENGLIATALAESCPVCQEILGTQKMVFQCGHVTCCKCFFALTERRSHPPGNHGKKWVMCPTCRQSTDFGNIAFADDEQDGPSGIDEKTEASVTVQGSYSTKIEAVTRRILWISSSDPGAKILVFSSWNDVLDVLQHALTMNSITYVRMKGGRKSQVAVSHFTGQKGNVSRESSNKTGGVNKTKSSVQVLLLLIQHGANGLNLLEAQHVILVEPLLNPAAEAQAIGRVHRIGQKHETLVHRFIVKNTVEESIYKLNKSRNTSSFISGNRKNQDQPCLTLKDVESLFRVNPTATEGEIPSGGSSATEDEIPSGGSLRDLPASVAAAIAAEKRLRDAEEETT